MTTRTLTIPKTSKGVGILNVTIGNIGTDYLGLVNNNVACVDTRHPLSLAKKKVLAKSRTAAKRTPDQLRDIQLCELVMSGYWKNQSRQQPQDAENPHFNDEVTLMFDGWDTPYVPGMNIKAMVRAAAKMAKRGKDIQQGLNATDSVLVYEGPKDANSLIADPRFDLRLTTCNGGKSSKVLKSRLLIPEWKLNVSITVDENVIDPETVIEYLSTAGRIIGLNDARTLGYGRFDILESPTYSS